MKKTFDEFKKFAMRGNVIDMAVGVIIGGAFGKIVSSLVGDVIMPAIGLLVGGVNFSDLKWVIKQAVVKDGEVVTPEVALNYGNFIQVTFDFLIIALAVFFFSERHQCIDSEERSRDKDSACSSGRYPVVDRDT